MQTRGMRGVAVALLVLGLGLLGVTTFRDGTQAATVDYADPKFAAQWKAGEALTPNFWGPLANARTGQQEPWNGGTRLVQYFDKGRMELDGANVTSGLLATELIRGQVQTGPNSFEPKSPPAIPLAGDAQNPGPTYAGLAGGGASLLAAATAQVATSDRSGITTSLEADGTVGKFLPGGSYAPASIGAFDEPTKHNVARAFVSFREKVGLTTVGYAIAEPFWSNILVGGERKSVLIQPFERRVLTYTPLNPPGFEVEIGNIGQQYFQWRYGGGQPGGSPQATPAPTSAAATATAGATPAETPAAGAATPSVIALNPTIAAYSTAQAVNATIASMQLTAVPPRPTDTTTATPLPAAAATPIGATAAATSTTKPVVAFQNPPGSIARGTTAMVAVNTTAGAYCTIAVTYPNGATRVDGLEDKTADANGKVSWSWRVGASAASGSTPIEVECMAGGQKTTATTMTYVSA